MTDDITVIEVPLETTFGMIKGMNIPDKDMVEAFAHSALRCVRMALAENNIYAAIDTLDKTRLVEEYIKSKVHRNQAQLQTQNIIAADRYEMLWELGGWLDENVAHNGGARPMTPAGKVIDGKPKFYLSDIGITDHQSEGWQTIRKNIPDINNLRTFCQDYIADGKELQWGLLWSFANPRPPKEPEQIPDIDITDKGKKFYMALKKLIDKYFEYLNASDVPLREYIFIGTMLMDAGKKLLGASSKIRDNEND